MSKRALDLLEAFDSLPADDKQTFAVEILMRTGELPFDSGPLADEEIGKAGKALLGFVRPGQECSPPAVSFGCSISGSRQRPARGGWAPTRFRERPVREIAPQTTQSRRSPGSGRFYAKRG